MAITPRAIALAAPGALAFVLLAIAAAISAVAPRDPSVQARQGEHRLFAPGVVSDAEGTYAPYATATPSPTPIGVQDAPNRLFVAFNGDDANAGARGDPFATISRALEVARDIEDAEIYVDNGLYMETITIIEQSVKLFGGHSPGTWEPVPNDFALILPTDTYALVIGDSNDVVVAGFDFRSGPIAPPGPLDRSRIPVLILSSTGVLFRDNAVIAGKALDGAHGEKGDNGAPGSDGQPGDASGVCPPTNEGGPGGSGAANGGRGGNGSAIAGPAGIDGQDISASVEGGTGGAGGAFPAGPGENGGPGEDGTSTLSPGASGGPVGFFDFGGYEPSHGEDGFSTNRLGGAGGGGGGGEAGGLFFVCGGGGGGGGGGGYPAESDGTGGQSGGASFGILIRGSEVEIINNEISTGDGGPGGNGGNAGIGGAEGDGGLGGGNGGNGGEGGRGGHSAPGGGGGGGPSIGIIADGDSEVVRSGNTFDLGQPGKGGLAGAFGVGPNRPPSGATGLRLEFYQDLPISLPEPPQPTN